VEVNNAKKIVFKDENIYSREVIDYRAMTEESSQKDYYELVKKGDSTSIALPSYNVIDIRIIILLYIMPAAKTSANIIFTERRCGIKYVR